jgi:hypothetical protein
VNAATAKPAPTSHHLKTAVGGLDKMNNFARNAITKNKKAYLTARRVSLFFKPGEV